MLRLFIFLMIVCFQVKADIDIGLMETTVLPLEVVRVCHEVGEKGHTNLDSSSKQYALSILQTAEIDPIVNRSLTADVRSFFHDIYQALLGTVISNPDPIASSLSTPSTENIPAPGPDLSLANADNADLQNALNGLAIIDVPVNLPGHQINAQKTAALKAQLKNVEIHKNFDRTQYTQANNEGSCIFLSTIASMMYTPQGRQKISELLLGYDDDFAYFKFHDITDAFRSKVRGDVPFQPLVNTIATSAFKVPLNIIETATAQDSYSKNSPAWLHLLMRAYHYLVLTYKELFFWLPEMGDRFSEIYTTIMTTDTRNNLIYFSPLVGKEQLTILQNADNLYPNGIKNDLTLNGNAVSYGRYNHAFSMLVNQNSVSSYNNLGGIVTPIAIPPGLSDNEFASAILRGTNTGYFQYFEPFVP